MSTYVLIHGAWHSGRELEPLARSIRAAGHEVFTPTVVGNGPGDSKAVGLADAIQSIADYLTENNLGDIVLVGHSYGGMIITGVLTRFLTASAGWYIGTPSSPMTARASVT